MIQTPQPLPPPKTKPKPRKTFWRRQTSLKNKYKKMASKRRIVMRDRRVRKMVLVTDSLAAHFRHPDVLHIRVPGGSLVESLSRLHVEKWPDNGRLCLGLGSNDMANLNEGRIRYEQ